MKTQRKEKGSSETENREGAGDTRPGGPPGSHTCPRRRTEGPAQRASKCPSQDTEAEPLSASVVRFHSTGNRFQRKMKTGHKMHQESEWIQTSQLQLCKLGQGRETTAEKVHPTPNSTPSSAVHPATGPDGDSQRSQKMLQPHLTRTPQRCAPPKEGVTEENGQGFEEAGAHQKKEMRGFPRG